jgi:hypothetical protein
MTPELQDLPQLPIELADPKPWYHSRGVIGAVAVIAAQTAAVFGLSLDAGQITEIVLQAVTLIGGLVALWGRLRAEQPIRGA